MVIFVLKLNNDKWYVGETSNLSQTLEKIQKGDGPFWTQRNRFVAVEKIYEIGDLKSITLDYMKKYGWQNVRGYAWEQWSMKEPPKTLVKLLRDDENQLVSNLRKKQNGKCSKCQTQLYEIEEDIQIRKWKRDCYRCNKSTEIVTYILDENEFGCVIGSHAEIDEILKTIYPQVENVFSKTQRRWLIGNKCQHCGAYQGEYFIEHELVWDAGLYYYDNSYDTTFPVVKVLSPGHLIFLDNDKNNKSV